MNEKIKAQLENSPFRPFSIEVNDGRSVAVPHPDHVLIGRFAVVVEDWGWHLRDDLLLE